MRKLVFIGLFLFMAINAFAQEPRRSVRVEVVKSIKITSAERDSYVVPVGESWKITLTDGSKWTNNGGAGWVQDTGGGGGGSYIFQSPLTESSGTVSLNMSAFDFTQILTTYPNLDIDSTDDSISPFTETVGASNIRRSPEPLISESFFIQDKQFPTQTIYSLRMLSQQSTTPGEYYGLLELGTGIPSVSDVLTSNPDSYYWIGNRNNILIAPSTYGGGAPTEKLVVDGNVNITGEYRVNGVAITGGSGDPDQTLSVGGSESDELTISGTGGNTVSLAEGIQDNVGNMVTGNSESGIEVTYDDANGKLNFNVTATGSGNPFGYTYQSITTDNQTLSIPSNVKSWINVDVGNKVLLNNTEPLGLPFVVRAEGVTTDSVSIERNDTAFKFTIDGVDIVTPTDDVDGFKVGGGRSVTIVRQATNDYMVVGSAAGDYVLVSGPPELFVTANAASDPNGNETDGTAGWTGVGASVASSSSDADLNGFTIVITANQDNGNDMGTYTMTGLDPSKTYVLIHRSKNVGNNSFLQILASQLDGAQVLQSISTGIYEERTVEFDPLGSSVDFRFAANLQSGQGAIGDQLKVSQISVKEKVN